MSTNFWAVPLFIRVEPVTNSGPTTTSIGNLEILEISLFWLQEILPVNISDELHAFIAPITYGVEPDAAMPITKSRLLISYFFKSNQPWFKSSSANSTAFLIAESPPAINPTTKPWGIPYVGGHSLASKTPKRPLVPAPI